MEKQSGFTLIELVVVILILGIIAVIAAPKFLSVEDEAKMANLHALKGSLSSVNSLIHSKANMQAKLGANMSMSLNGEQITLNYGYPKGDIANLTKFFDFGSGNQLLGNCGAEQVCQVGDWYMLTMSMTGFPDNNIIAIAASEDDLQKCAVLYIPKLSDANPTQPAAVNILDTDC